MQSAFMGAKGGSTQPGDKVIAPVESAISAQALNDSSTKGSSMKMRLKLLLATLIATWAVGMPIAKAAVDVGISAGIQINATADFYEPLTPYGSWVNFSTYGRCWHPSQVDADWRPYSNGSWVWTDAGWYWQSDEPWSWACYHYGSWNYDTSYGWIWIPATDWAVSTVG